MSQTSTSFFGRANQFTKIWKGGYFEGNPLDPTTSSTYVVYGYNSFLYTTYLVCIKPFVNKSTTVLEIGPGRGAWTKTFVHLGAQKIYCLDAAPPEHTGFYEYVGRHDSINYITVDDTNLDQIENNSIDFFFSFGVFCHLPREIVAGYIRNLASKMKPGANGFMMVGDFDKYNRCIERRSTIFNYHSRWVLPFKLLWQLLKVVFPEKIRLTKIKPC
ncbi:class I SAM-dependent methyltransferase [Bradyrhizobium sp. RDM12]